MSLCGAHLAYLLHTKAANFDAFKCIKAYIQKISIVCIKSHRVLYDSLHEPLRVELVAVVLFC